MKQRKTGRQSGDRQSGGRDARTLAEDVLKQLAHAGRLEAVWHIEAELPDEMEPMLGEALAYLREAEQVTEVDGGWRLTDKGRARAVELLRAHRLLETYLARKEGRPASELHAEADRAEHFISPEGVNDLADSMNRPRFDPHGDPIPEREHDLHAVEQVSLRKVPSGSRLRIVHIEDEPEADFSKLMDLGMAVELPIEVVNQESGQTVVELAGESIVLSPELAGHVEVCSWPESEPFPEGLSRLSELEIGESGTVAFLSPACMGPERRRLLDFGLVPGSDIQCEFKSPFGSPVAYRVRGSTLGLRLSQAKRIFIHKLT